MIDGYGFGFEGDFKMVGLICLFKIVVDNK